MVRRIWEISLSRLCESQTHQSGFWSLPVLWFPFQLFSQLCVWPHHWSQKLQCSGLAEVFTLSHSAAAEMWPWGNLQTTGIELYIKYTCPTQGRSPKMTLIFPLPHWDLLLWVGMVAPEVICKFPSHYCSLRWIFPCEGTGCETSPELFSHPGLAPEAMSRVTARSLTHRGVKHGMPGSSSDLLLEEKVLFSTFSFWHDCTPLSSSYSSWTLNSLQNSLANHKIPFFLPPCFTLLCY